MLPVFPDLMFSPPSSLLSIYPLVSCPKNLVNLYCEFTVSQCPWDNQMPVVQLPTIPRRAEKDPSGWLRPEQYSLRSAHTKGTSRLFLDSQSIAKSARIQLTQSHKT